MASTVISRAEAAPAAVAPPPRADVAGQRIAYESFITGLLASHLFLRTGWRRVVLVAFDAETAERYRCLLDA